MQKLCDHDYDGSAPLRIDCDSCTALRAKKVGHIKAEAEQDEVRRALGKDVRRCKGGIVFGSGWTKFDMRGQQID